MFSGAPSISTLTFCLKRVKFLSQFVYEADAQNLSLHERLLISVVPPCQSGHVQPTACVGALVL